MDSVRKNEILADCPIYGPYHSHPLTYRGNRGAGHSQRWAVGQDRQLQQPPDQQIHHRQNQAGMVAQQKADINASIKVSESHRRRAATTSTAPELPCRTWDRT